MKEYQKPEAEIVSLIPQEDITYVPDGEAGLGSSEF